MTDHRAGEPVDGDFGEANRGVGQQIIGDTGAPPPELDPAAGGPGTGAGEVGSVRPDKSDHGAGAPS